MLVCHSYSRPVTIPESHEATLHVSPPAATASAAVSGLFPETEMGRLCRAKDWSTTPLGPVSTWPTSLRTTSAMVLRQGLPQALCWGPSLHQIYNDGYRLILGDKHPEALGTPVLET